MEVSDRGLDSKIHYLYFEGNTQNALEKWDWSRSRADLLWQEELRRVLDRVPPTHTHRPRGGWAKLFLYVETENPQETADVAMALTSP